MVTDIPTVLKVLRGKLIERGFTAGWEAVPRMELIDVLQEMQSDLDTPAEVERLSALAKPTK